MNTTADAKSGYLLLKLLTAAAVTFLLAGCLALPDLRGKDFAEYYQEPDRQTAAEIDAKLKASSGKPIEVNQQEFGEVVLRSPLPVLVLVYATWCDPCRLMEPAFTESAKAYEGRVRFVKIDFDKNEQLCRKMGPMAFPMLFLIKGDTVVDRWGGANDVKNRIREHIKEKLGIIG